MSKPHHEPRDERPSLQQPLESFARQRLSNSSEPPPRATTADKFKIIPIALLTKTRESIVEFTPQERSLDIKARVVDFMDKHIYPLNKHYLDIAHSDRRNGREALAFVDDLRAQAKRLGLWNLVFHTCVTTSCSPKPDCVSPRVRLQGDT